MRWLLCILFYPLFIAVNAQNIIPNPSFEILDSCPSGGGSITFAKHWIDANFRSPDTFAPCYTGTDGFGVPYNWKGHQFSHTGENYAGAHLYSSVQNPDYEYIEVELIESIIPKQKYYLSYYVSLAENSAFYMQQFGVHFSDTLVLDSTKRLDYLTPQAISDAGQYYRDEEEWMKIEDTIILDKSAKFMVVGNFRTPQTTLILPVDPNDFNPSGQIYYYYDDFELYRIIPEIVVNGKSFICIGDSVKLTAKQTDSIGWSTISNPNEIFSTNRNIMVTPNKTTTYILNTILDTIYHTIHVDTFPIINIQDTFIICPQQEVRIDLPDLDNDYLWNDGNFGNQKIMTDTGHYWVQINEGPCISSDSFVILHRKCDILIPNIITPNGDGFNDVFFIKNLEYDIWELKVYNRWGKPVYQTENYQNDWQGEGLIDGIYYYKLESNTVEEKYKGWVNMMR